MHRERATGMSGMGAGDVDELLGQGDTLLMITQQHNAKEEGMLYLMAAQALLAGRIEEIGEKPDALRPG